MTRKGLPRAQIEWIVDRMHVGTSNADVESDIRSRCAANGWTAATTNAAVRCALRRHADNRSMYQVVTGGMS